MAEAKIQSTTQATSAKSDDDKVKEEAAANAAVDAHPNKGQFVQYLGPRNAALAAANDEFKKRAPKLGEGTVAEITAIQWKEAGIQSTRTHRWNLANDWKIPATQFTAEQVDYLLTASKRFELVNAEGQKVDR